MYTTAPEADVDRPRERTFAYTFRAAREFELERPTIADLERARAHALGAGDRRRAAAYGLVIAHRIEAAQAAARRDP